MPTDYFNDQLENNAVIIPSDEGETLKASGVEITFKVTSEMSNDQLGVYNIVIPPMGIGANLHYHRFMDETFIINEGIVTLQIADKTYKANPGTTAYIPRFTPHGFRNDTDKAAKLTLIFNPSQKREGFFKGLHELLNEQPINPEKYLKLYNKYDSFPVDKHNILSG